MSNMLIAAGLVVLAGNFGTNRSVAAERVCPIFPQPKEYRVKADTPVALAGPVAIVIGEEADEPEKFAASRLAYVLKKRFGIDAPVVTEKTPVKDTASRLVLGTLESNSLLKSLKEKHAVKLNALEDKDPMQDAFAIEVLRDGGQEVVLMIGMTSRSVIYAQYAFLETVRREGGRVVHPHMSVRDWSALRYRDWWPGNPSYFPTTDALDQVTYARANMTQFRVFDSSQASEEMIMECWKRGLKPYGVLNGAIAASVHAHAVRETQAWLKKGCYGIYISFDDAGMGEDAEGLCNKVTAVIKERFGEVGDRIAVVGHAYGFLNSGDNRRMRGFRDFAEAIFYITGPAGGQFITKQHYDHAREAGIENFIWWHNFPCGARGFFCPAPKPRYIALLPFNRNCWGRFTFDDLREGDKHMTGMSAQNEGFELAALQLFWAWDPVHYEYEKARTAIYRQRHGAAAVEAVRKLDDNMYALTDYYIAMWRNWAVTVWPLKDVSKRAEVLALIEEMQEQFQVLKAGKSVSYLSDEGYDEHYIEPLEAHLDAARRLASLDFPDYAVVKREGFNERGAANLLKGWAALSLKEKMIQLLWAGKADEAEAYLADLSKEALPMLEVIEKELKDLWYTEEYVNAWRGMMKLSHWEPIAAETFSEKFSLRIGRNAEGLVVMETTARNCDILFTLDGPLPEAGAAEVYSAPLDIPGSCIIRAVIRQKDTGLRSRVLEHRLGYPKTAWKIVYVDSEGDETPAANAIDENRDTVWMTEREKDTPAHPHEIRIDLGRETAIQGIGIYPRRNNGGGVPQRYELYVSHDGREWGHPLVAGAFGSIEDCMIVSLPQRTKAHFIRMVFLSDFGSTPFSAVAELDLFDFAPRPAVSPKVELLPGLRYRYYESSVLWCEELETKEVVARGVIDAPTLRIEGRREDLFGAVYEGYVRIPRDGFYTFSMDSDDGSVMWLDGLLLIDNDGQHAMRRRSNAISLAEGLHALRIAFFDSGGADGLDVYWQPPGEKQQLLPPEVLFHGAALPAKSAPLVFDKEIGHYKDLSYEALSDEGLSWEEKTRLFGGDTVHYGELTDEQRKAKEEELRELLDRIDTKLVAQCEADIRQWLDEQIAAIPEDYVTTRGPGETDWKLRFGAVVFFRAYEIFGDKKYLGAGLTCADRILAKQWPKGHWRWGEYPEDWVRIQDGYNDWPFRVMLYAYKVSGDRKYFESAKRCADVLLLMQRPGGGWPDQYTFSDRPTIHTGVRHGISFNDQPTTSTFAMMVMMYHMTGDRKYIANVHNLWPFIVKGNIGEGKVVGWCQQYNDDATPVRARQYEIEVCYPSSLTRATGPLLIWFYLMDGDEAHMDLLRKAYAWFEQMRRFDLKPENWKCWRIMNEAHRKDDGPDKYFRPGWSGAYLPDGSNCGGILGYRMYPNYPITEEMRREWGGFIHSDAHLASLATDGPHPMMVGEKRGDLYKWASDVLAGKPAVRTFDGGARGNTLVEVRRALLEYKRGGREGLLKYYSGPVKYTPDQYLQARVDAAKRALDERNVRLAAMHEKGIRSVADCGSLVGAKIRWYGPKGSKWGKAYDDYIMREGKWLGNAAWYQWQLVYDTMLAQGKIDPDAAARGGRGFETFAFMTHLDSWDVLNEWDMACHELENHFDVPIGE